MQKTVTKADIVFYPYTPYLGYHHQYACIHCYIAKYLYSYAYACGKHTATIFFYSSQYMKGNLIILRTKLQGSNKKHGQTR